MIVCIRVDFTHNDQSHQAILNFAKPRVSGLIERIGQKDEWITVMNATPEEIVEELRDKYQVTLPAMLIKETHELRPDVERQASTPPDRSH